MSEETNVLVEETKVDTTQDYIDTIKSMKANSVSREEYDKIRDENKRLLESLVNGEVVNKEVEEEPVDIGELRSKIFSQEISNLDYWTNALKLREALINKGEKDPFLPYGQNIAPTYEDIQAANRVADVVSQCIEYADGDSALFTQELQRRTNDVRIRR